MQSPCLTHEECARIAEGRADFDLLRRARAHAMRCVSCSGPLLQAALSSRVSFDAGGCRAEDEEDACPAEDDVLAFIGGRLPLERAQRMEQHLDGCSFCSALISDLMRGATLGAGHPEALESELDLCPGKQIDHFTLQKILGAGGFGEVWLARDERLARPVAIKLLPQCGESEKARERFIVEARVTARLSHPNVVTIHFIGEHEGTPYFALEYVTGVTLRRRLEEGPVDVAFAVRIARAVADAVAYASRMGVLHLDLKPDNIMLGEDGRVRVVDFGLARRVRPSDDARLSIDSMPMALCGTPHYMAPEQWLQDEVSPKTDVWGLGVVLYEMLAGRRPFTAQAMALGVEITQEKPLPPLPDTVPAPLHTLVGRMLCRHVTGRPNPAEVLAALDAVPHEASTQEAPSAPLPPPQAMPAQQPRPRLVVAAVALLVLLVGGAVLTLAPWRQPDATAVIAPVAATQPAAAPAAATTLPATPPPVTVAAREAAVATKAVAATTTAVTTTAPTMASDVHEDASAARGMPPHHAPPTKRVTRPPRPRDDAPPQEHQPVPSPAVATVVALPASTATDALTDEQRAAQARLEDLKQKRRRSGLLFDDVAGLRDAFSRAEAAVAARPFNAQRAGAHLDEASAQLDSVAVDQGFIERKLERLRRRAEAASADGTLDPLLDKALRAALDGRFDDANRALNDLDGALRRQTSAQDR